MRRRLGFREGSDAWAMKSGKFPEGWVICDGTNGTPDLRGSSWSVQPDWPTIWAAWDATKGTSMSQLILIALHRY